MALLALTPTPRTLQTKIRNAIANSEVQTWQVDEDGYLIYTPEQWSKLAEVRLTIVPGSAIVFAIHGRTSQPLTVQTYAVYMGRLAQMLLAHFDKDFNNLQITALLDTDIGDES